MAATLIPHRVRRKRNIAYPPVFSDRWFHANVIICALRWAKIAPMSMTDNTALSTWHALVSAHAARRFKNERSRPRDLAAVMHVPDEAGYVAAWLAGSDAPRTQERHDALMKALELPETMRDVPIDVEDGPRLDKARLRDAIEDAWEAIPQARKALEPVVTSTAPMRHSTRAVSSTHHTQDHPALPRRIHQSSLGYNTLAPHELDRILEQTGNVHEFVTAFRQRYCWTEEVQQLAKKLGFAHYKSIDVMENGSQQITHVDRFKELITQRSCRAALAERLEDLAIENRLQIIHDPSTGNNSIGDLFAYMPKKYWRYVLDREDIAHPPPWAGLAMPIGTKGDYLRALFGATDYTVTEMSPLIGLASGSLRTYFHTTNTLGATQMERLAQCIPQFDAQRYRALPVGRTAWLATGHVAALADRDGVAGAARGA